jgi:hypothetical protein
MSGTTSAILLYYPHLPRIDNTIPDNYPSMTERIPSATPRTNASMCLQAYLLQASWFEGHLKVQVWLCMCLNPGTERNH